MTARMTRLALVVGAMTTMGCPEDRQHQARAPAESPVRVKAQTTASVLATVVVAPLMEMSFSAIEESAAATAAKDPRVLYIAVAQKNGVVVARGGPQAKAVGDKIAVVKASSVTEREVGGKAAFVVSAPVEYEGEARGSLVLAYAKGP